MMFLSFLVVVLHLSFVSKVNVSSLVYNERDGLLTGYQRTNYFFVDDTASYVRFLQVPWTESRGGRYLT